MEKIRQFVVNWLFPKSSYWLTPNEKAIANRLFALENKLNKMFPELND